jgi:translation initiation factor IF-3
LKSKETLINKKILYSIKGNVRCIGSNGEAYGIIPVSQALTKAENSGYDLVLISDAKVPVVKIMDYSKYKYEQNKMKKEARKKQKKIDVKEIKLTAKIAQNDINYKVKHAIEFLQADKHVRFKIFLRGREMANTSIANPVIAIVKSMIEDYAIIEKGPSLEGRNIVMYTTPSKDIKNTTPIKDVKDFKYIKPDEEKKEEN